MAAPSARPYCSAGWFASSTPTRSISLLCMLDRQMASRYPASRTWLGPLRRSGCTIASARSLKQHRPACMAIARPLMMLR
eukprot:6180692-Pleurochrysis_carterae.AAC.3